jgi:hypothetical protein
MKRRLLAISLVAGLVVACRSQQVPRPPTGPHRPQLEDTDQVDYPPPPARIEEIDPRAHHADGCVWVDGSWRWSGRRWVWESGAWVHPPPGCYFAPAESFWQSSAAGPGVLYYRNPAWYPESSTSGNGRPCPPVQPCE